MLILLRKKHGALRGVPAGWVACNEVQAQGGAPLSFSIEYEKIAYFDGKIYVLAVLLIL